MEARELANKLHQWRMAHLSVEQQARQIAAAHAADLIARDVELEEMREAFEPLVEMCYDDPNDDGDSDWNRILAQANKALAATPKRVRWMVEGKAVHQKAGVRGDVTWVNLKKNGELVLDGGKELSGKMLTVAVIAEGEGDEQANS